MQRLSGEAVYQREEFLDLKWFDFDNAPENRSPTIIPALKSFVSMKRI